MSPTPQMGRLFPSTTPLVKRRLRRTLPTSPLRKKVAVRIVRTINIFTTPVAIGLGLVVFRLGRVGDLEPPFEDDWSLWSAS